MSRSEFIVETNPTPEQIQYLEDRLYEFNSRTTGITDGQGLAICMLDDRNRIVAGICGGAHLLTQVNDPVLTPFPV